MDIRVLGCCETARSTCLLLYFQVWARPTSDGGAAVALYNAGDKATAMTVTFSDIPARSWSRSTVLKVRDMWAHTENGTATDRLPRQ